jgi:polyvinyl alcohol dehydrogenase (cytochrome)
MHDLANSGSNPNETTIGPGNVAGLTVKWDFPITDKIGAKHFVSASPTVANDRVYIGAWNGIMYALRASDGRVQWKFDTADPNPQERGGLTGIQSSAAVLADGRVYFGAADAYYYCLDDRGRLIWRTQVGNPDESSSGGEGAHAWSSPAVHDGKVFVGRSSHDDGPCIRGRVYALDQDTGAVVWQVNVVPEMVCDNAPTTTCTSSAECGGGNCISNRVCSKQATQFCNTTADCNGAISGNVCIESRGGAVWSSAAVDPSRNEVYVSTGDCLQQGAIGDAESLMAFDLDTGARHWAVRANPIGETADFDFGSSPAVFTATDGVTSRELVGAGNKNGAYYAVDRDTGLLAWSTQVVPGSVLGGYIGSSAVADGQIFSATFSGPPYVHSLDAFDGSPGSVAYASINARSFAAAAHANGVVYVGSQRIAFANNGLNRFRAFDASTGALLLDLSMPGGVASGAAIANGTVYVGYGVFLDGGTSGGVQALGLP